MQELKELLTTMVRYEKGALQLKQDISKKSVQHTRARYAEDDERMHELEGELHELNASFQNTQNLALAAKQAALKFLGLEPDELQPLFEPA